MQNSADIAEQLKTKLSYSEDMRNKVCTLPQGRTPPGPVGDFEDIGAPPLVR